jgi:hypothetical protein
MQPLLAGVITLSMVVGVAALHDQGGTSGTGGSSVGGDWWQSQTQITPLLELLIVVVVGVETLALHHLGQDNQVRLEALA